MNVFIANAWEMILATDGGMNFMGYSDPIVDELFVQGRMETNPAARIEIYRQIAQRVNDAAAFIPLYFTNMAYIHHANIRMGFIGPTANFRVDAIRWVD